MPRATSYPTSDPFLVDYSWLSPALQTETQPAVRIDYNIGDKHRLTGTFNKLWQDRNPDQLNDFDHNFPDSPNYRHTVVRRPTRSIALRSTLTSSLVNEARVGITVGERLFFGQDHSNGPQTFDDMGGYAVDLDGNIGLTNWLALEAARASFQTTRVSGTRVNGFRFGTGWVARIGETTDQSTGQEEISQRP